MSSDENTNKNQVTVSLSGHDEIYLEYCSKKLLATSFSVTGCFETINKCKILAETFKKQNLSEWSIPTGNAHSDLLIRELLMKVNGSWDYPYKEDEICHCRMVPTKIVDQAILAGGHTIEKVISMTGAASACGACQVDINKIIDYRLNRNLV